MGDLRFASWARGPVGRAILEEDRSGTLPPPELKAALSLARPDGTTTPPVEGPELKVLGPDGIAGIDSRVVVRLEPPAGAGEVEDSYLAAVELSQIDLPWLHTPARPDARNRLRPWIVLVVAEAARSTLTPGSPPTLSVGVDQLPDLDDSWAWAHVQLPAAAATPPPGLEKLVGQSVARLVCPRRLAPSTAYRACIVPAFTLDAGGNHAPAWSTSDAEVVLPVYLSWEFATGVDGDFEQLVRRLAPAPADRIRSLGTRLVDISRPWSGADALSDVPATLAVPGALRSLGAGPVGSASDAVLAEAARRLADQLNVPDELLAAAPGDDGDATGAVAPPIYGGRHVNQKRVSATPPGVQPIAAEGWVDTLNLGPATRIAAGVGAAYVRANQETLMARAWEQVGAIREANRRRALGELAAAVSKTVHRRHVVTMQTGELMAFGALAAGRTRASDGPLPLATELTVSTLDEDAASPAFARFTRRRSVARAAGQRLASTLERGLEGTVAVPAPQPLVGRLPPAASADAPGGEVAGAALQASLANDATGAASRVIGLQAVAEVARVNGLEGDGAALRSQLAIPVLDNARFGSLRLMALAIRPHLVSVASVLETVGAKLSAPALPGEAPQPSVTRFGIRIDSDALGARVKGALAPGDRIARRVAARVEVPGGGPTLDPVMAAPSFPAPMSLALASFAPDWLIPGVSGFPADACALLEPEPAFIESFLVGLAHEMGSELRWREFPTDLRGTPFAHFWPRPDGMADIPPIHTWSGVLGQHLAGTEGGLSVLLVRGTVVRRFPDMIVSAVPSTDDLLRSDALPAGTKQPLFVVPIDEQTTAYAFAVDEALLRAPPTAAAPGWYFGFQEHSYRIRFGFDLPAADHAFDDWNDLDWNRVVDHRGFAFAGRDLTPPAPARAGGVTDPKWDRDAADVGRIALRRPFRVLVHASVLTGE